MTNNQPDQDSEPFVDIHIIQTNSLHCFNKEVNKFIAKGWQFHGEIQLEFLSSGVVYYQAMIYNFYEDGDEEPDPSLHL